LKKASAGEEGRLKPGGLEKTLILLLLLFDSAGSLSGDPAGKTWVLLVGSMEDPTGNKKNYQ
jgi:hypothetical protein